MDPPSLSLSLSLHVRYVCNIQAWINIYIYIYNGLKIEILSSFYLSAAIHTDSYGYVRQAAIVTENNLVMKQQKSTYTAVGTETSILADEKLPLGSSTVNSIRPSFKNC
jgi:hypothetical protein